MSEYNLEESIYELLLGEPFFASISRDVKKVATTKLPTAAVGIEPDGNLVMYYNPSYFEKLTFHQRRGCIKHEFYHLIFQHLTDRSSAARRGKFKKEWNISTDLAINSLLEKEERHPSWCIPGEKTAMVDKEGNIVQWVELYNDLPKEQSSEFYFLNLPQKVKDMCQAERDYEEALKDAIMKGLAQPQCPDSQTGQFDGHEWEVSPEIADMVREAIRGKVQKAINEAAAKGWGTISASTRDKIIKSVKSEIPPDKLLKYFVRTSIRSDKKGSIKKINKRYPYQFPGKKVNRTSKIAIAIDQSGSVDDGMLSAFFGIIEQFAKFTDFVIVPFDCEVGFDKIYTWKKGTRHKCERVLMGGTDFNAPTKYVNERKDIDGLMILTDMQAPKPIKCNVKRIWITTPENKQNCPFDTGGELVVAIKSKAITDSGEQ